MNHYYEYLENEYENENTIKSYKSNYNVLSKGLEFNKYLTQKQFINYVVSLEKSHATKTQYLKFGISYFKSKGLEHNKISAKFLKYKNKTLQNRNHNTMEKLESVKNNTGIKCKKDLLEKLDYIDICKEPIKYILNFLIIKLNCSNQSLIIRLLKDDEEYVTGINMNYLYIENNQIHFINQYYKTCRERIKKHFIIDDDKFMEAFKLLREKGRKYLLEKRNGSKMPYTMLAKNIIKYTIDNISQNTINNIIINELIEKGDKKELNKLCKYKGIKRNLLMSYF